MFDPFIDCFQKRSPNTICLHPDNSHVVDEFRHTYLTEMGGEIVTIQPCWKISDSLHKLVKRRARKDVSDPIWSFLQWLKFNNIFLEVPPALCRRYTTLNGSIVGELKELVEGNLSRPSEGSIIFYAKKIPEGKLYDTINFRSYTQSEKTTHGHIPQNDSG